MMNKEDTTNQQDGHTPPDADAPPAVREATASVAGNVDGSDAGLAGPETVASPDALNAAAGEPAVTSTADGADAAPIDGVFEVEGMELRPVLEAILFSTDAPISAGKLAQTVGLDSTKPINAAIAELNAIYGERHAAYRVEERAGGYQLLTLPQYAQYIQRLTKARDEGRLTPAALETLAIIAYRQPILRVDVESIRGVACGEVIRTLMEYNLVKIVGRAEEIGRPMLYGTTRHFLEVFGLSTLKDLPSADQLKEPKTAGNAGKP